MRSIITILSLFIGITTFCSEAHAQSTSYSYKIIRLENHSYGYDIYNNGKKIIHQPVIPGKEGTNGFDRKIHAKRTARLVIQKLEQNIQPTITIKELEQILKK